MLDGSSLKIGFQFRPALFKFTSFCCVPGSSHLPALTSCKVGDENLP